MGLGAIGLAIGAPSKEAEFYVNDLQMHRNPRKHVANDDCNRVRGRVEALKKTSTTWHWNSPSKAIGKLGDQFDLHASPQWNLRNSEGASRVRTAISKHLYKEL
jgi:hypothetical protein